MSSKHNDKYLEKESEMWKRLTRKVIIIYEYMGNIVKRN